MHDETRPLLVKKVPRAARVAGCTPPAPGGGWGRARNSVTLSSLRRPTGEERCPGARATPRCPFGAGHAGATVRCTSPGGGEGGDFECYAARRERKPGGLGLEPEHGAYLQERSDVKAPL